MQLEVFKNTGFEIRGGLVDEQPYFVLADVCKALDITNVTDVKNRLNKDGVVSIEVIDAMGRTQNVNAINESNLYKTIFQSRKEEAQIFQEWVTSEVLPTIRKHGVYASEQKLEEMIANPDFTIKLLETLKLEREQKQAALRTIEEQRPLITYAETVSTAVDGVTLREWIGMMKHEDGLKVGEHKVINFLIDKKYLYRNSGGKLIPYANRFDYFSTEPIIIATPKGNKEFPSLKITGKGQVALVEKVLNHFMR